MTATETQILEWMECVMSVRVSPNYILAGPRFMRAFNVAKVSGDAEMEADLRYPLYSMRLGPRNRKIKRYIRRAIQSWKRANPVKRG